MTITTIFDGPRHVLQKYLDLTGQTEAEARKRHDEIAERVNANPGPIEGADPSQEAKFSAPTAYDIK
jgi:hypothetical protein